MKGNNHIFKLFEEFMGDTWPARAGNFPAAEIVRLYDSFLCGWHRARELPVRLQTDSNWEIPVRYMQRQGDHHFDVGAKPDWIERVEWRASENMVYIFFRDAQ